MQPTISDFNVLRSWVQDKFKQREDRKPFGSFGEQLVAVWEATLGHRADPRLAEIENRAPTGLGEAVDSGGGFLVQPQFVQDLYLRMLGTGEILGRCRTFPMKSAALIEKKFDESSRGNGSRFGGVLAYWKKEAELKTVSKPKFGLCELVSSKLTALVFCTDEMLGDVPALESIVSEAVTSELTFQAEGSIIAGDGAGECLGVIVAPGTITQDAELGQAPHTLVAENITKMYSRMWGPGRKNAVWLINPDGEPQLYSAGIAAANFFSPAGAIAGSPYAGLFGRPVIPCEYCPAIGNVGDLIFGNFGAYLVGTREIQQAVSAHVAFLTDEQAFRFTLRISGQPAESRPLTPLNSAVTQSDFVILQART